MNLPDFLSNLNPEQREAAMHSAGPLLILAGAGSGKTTVLVSRAGRLVQEGLVTPERLCVLTFTNKAARELKSRVTARLGPKAKAIWAGTFHSFGLFLLRQFYREAGLTKEFGILDAADSRGIVKEILRDYNSLEKESFDPERILSLLSDWRSGGRTVAEKDDEYESATEWLLPHYRSRLTTMGLVDFDGLILSPIELMRRDPAIRERIQGLFDYVMVDEFQDTNESQLELVRSISGRHNNLAVVGDDDQAIYGWRGACVENILNFPKLYSQCRVVRLERNYRSTPAVLKLANAIIKKNTQRHEKVLRWRPDAEEGIKPVVRIFEDESGEAEGVVGEIERMRRDGFKLRDIAVLYRSNGQGTFLEAELRKNAVAYRMSGGTAFFERKEAKDALAYLRCAFSPNELSVRRVINTPSRGIGEKTIQTLSDYAHQQAIPFARSTRAWKDAGLDLSTGASIETFWHSVNTLATALIEEPNTTAGEVFLKHLDALGYRAHLEKVAGDAAKATHRWRGLEALASILNKFVEKGGRTRKTVLEFLEALMLRDNEEEDEDHDSVHLLTLHACKGLEFPAVILMGLEEDSLPHKTLGSDIAEERRLFYVGVTRAKRELVLTRALKRRRHGREKPSQPSRFLLELPKELYDEKSGASQGNVEGRRSMLKALFDKLDALDGDKPANPVGNGLSQKSTPSAQAIAPRKPSDNSSISQSEYSLPRNAGVESEISVQAPGEENP